MWAMDHLYPFQTTNKEISFKEISININKDIDKIKISNINKEILFRKVNVVTFFTKCKELFQLKKE